MAATSDMNVAPADASYPDAVFADPFMGWEHLEWGERDMQKALRDPKVAAQFERDLLEWAPDAGEDTRLDMCALFFYESDALTVAQAEMVADKLHIIDAELQRAGARGRVGQSKADLLSVGHEAMVRAMISWRPKLGSYEQHARCTVRRAFVDDHRKRVGYGAAAAKRRASDYADKPDSVRVAVVSLDPRREVQANASGVFSGAFVDTSAPSIEDDTQRETDRARINAAMQELTEAQQVVVEMVHVWDISVAEFARMHRISRQTVHTRLKRGLANLRRALGRQSVPPLG